MRKRMILMVLVTAAALAAEFPRVRDGIKLLIDVVKALPDSIFG
jgi:hypothetical protein